MAYDAEAAAAAVPPPDEMSGEGGAPAPGGVGEGEMIAMQDFEAAGSIEERAAALKDFIRQCVAEYMAKGK